MLEYASTAMLFADKRVDSNIISWNRYALFLLASTRSRAFTL